MWSGHEEYLTGSQNVPVIKIIRHDRKGTIYGNVGQWTLKADLKHFTRKERGVQE